MRLTNDLMDYELCCLDLTQDGKTLVDTEQTTVSDLWVAPAGNATKAKPITTKEPAIGRLSWMPNGSIVFANGDGNLVVVNPDGSGRTLLTPNERPNWDPSACGMGAISSTPPTGNKRSEYGAWIATAQTRSESPTRRSPTARNVPRTASGWSICGVLPGPRCVYPSTEGRHRRLHRTLWPPVIRRCRWAVFSILSRSPQTESESRISPCPTRRSKIPGLLLLPDQIN